MSEDTFPLAIKSTIDKYGVAIAQALSPSTLFVDLDDITAVEDVMASDAPAILWELSTVEDAPADPLYRISFSIGARTTNDAANYDIMKIMGKIRKVFGVGNYLPIADYSALVATAQQGVMMIQSTDVNQQAFDRTSGVRLATVTALVQRWL